MHWGIEPPEKNPPSRGWRRFRPHRARVYGGGTTVPRALPWADLFQPRQGQDREQRNTRKQPVAQSRLIWSRSLRVICTERLIASRFNSPPSNPISSAGRFLARWIGQDGQDWTAAGPCVGPDGIQDVRIQLSGLRAKSAIKAIRVEGPAGSRWEFGTNPKLLANAELSAIPKIVPKPISSFQPDRDTNSQRSRVMVLYDNDQLDAAAIVAGRSDPKLRMKDRPLPELVASTAKVRWLGQDGANTERPGDVHVAISGLPGKKPIDGAVLSDSMRRVWIFRGSDRAPKSPEPEAQSFQMKIDPTGKSADLFFPPYREAGGEPFVLRLIDSSGRSEIIRFQGERCELSRRAPTPAPSRTLARPGDELQALVDQHGTVVLSAGTYRLTRPLVLKRPVTLTSEGGATLLFAQASSETPWSAAIKILRGNTTLNGFAVRFEGPVRWNNEISWGPALIGMTDNLDPDQDEFKPNIVLTHLDLEAPPVETRGAWVDAVRLMRLLRARSGVISNNILRGGAAEFFEGPWRIVDNVSRGTPPGTISHAVFVGHGTRDLVIRGNQTHSPQPERQDLAFSRTGRVQLRRCDRAQHDRRDRGPRQRHHSLEQRARAYPHRELPAQVRRTDHGQLSRWASDPDRAHAR